MQVCWPTANSIVSCSADKTVACWDANKGIRTRKFLEHTAIVNSVAVAKEAPHLIASGSDDCTVILWDARSKKSVGSIYHDYQVCAVALAADGQSVYAGGIDNTIRRFDLRSGVKYGWDVSKLDLDTPDLVLEGHTDTITGLSLSPDGNHLLSNAMDSQLRCWDVRPFASGGPGAKDSRVSAEFCFCSFYLHCLVFKPFLVLNASSHSCSLSFLLSFPQLIPLTTPRCPSHSVSM